MCCEPGNDMPTVDECPNCGGPVDIDGDSTDVCPYSDVQCEKCGWAPCDGSC